MVDKVWAYIVRARAQQIELLVFDHVDVDAGTQIPAGTVEANEDLDAAIAREVFEEAAIRMESFTLLKTIERNWAGVDVRARNGFIM